MAVDTLVEDARWAACDLPRLAGVAGDATLRHLGLLPEAWEIAVLGCDDARIAALNGDFRAKPQATNVLSWPSAERGAAMDGAAPDPPAAQDAALGDIAIAYDTCLAEARLAQKTLSAHATHLIVHATLHILGYDHIRSGDADRMERIEVEILAGLGLADPYETDRTPGLA